MAIRTFLHRIVFPLVFAVSLVGLNVSLPHAAEPQSAPAAQKKAVAQKKPVARTKIQPRPSSSHLTDIPHSAPRTAKPNTAAPKKLATAGQQATAKAPQPVPANDKILSALDVFAKGCVTSMNKQRTPGIYKKEVKCQPDGMFMARYLAVDPDSLQTSYSPTDGHKTITHIGRMDYHEVEYVSVGKNQKQALAGPFNEVNRSPVTELIKYKKGKWSY